MNAHITRSILFQLAAIVAIVITVRSGDQPDSFETCDAYFVNAPAAKPETDYVATHTPGNNDDSGNPEWMFRSSGSVIGNSSISHTLYHGQTMQDRIHADGVQFATVVSGSRGVSLVDARYSQNPAVSDCPVPPIEIQERCAACVRGMVLRGLQPHDGRGGYVYREEHECLSSDSPAARCLEPQADCGRCVCVPQEQTCVRPPMVRILEASHPYSGVAHQARAIGQRCAHSTDYITDCTADCIADCTKDRPTRIGARASLSRAGLQVDRAHSAALASHLFPRAHASDAFGGRRGIRAKFSLGGHHVRIKQIQPRRYIVTGFPASAQRRDELGAGQSLRTAGSVPVLYFFPRVVGFPMR